MVRQSPDGVGVRSVGLCSVVDKVAASEETGDDLLGRVREDLFLSHQVF